ncbi:MAG: hypothetical protein K5696_00145 [Lachnospiraceae bacterium]|nr:hypothetical protein [Lachnospiraceae bacterium]
MSNLYKSYFTNRQENRAPVVINANTLFERRMEEKKKKDELRQLAYGQHLPVTDAGEDEFSSLNPEQLAMLTADPEAAYAAEEGSVMPAQEVAAGPTEEELAAAQAELDAIREQSEQLIKEAEQQSEEIRANAAKQGYEEGYRAGQQEAEREHTVQMAALEQRERDLQTNYDRLLEEAEPRMVDALTRIYEHVFAVRLAQDKDVILHLLQQTLSRADPTGDFLIHVSSADYEAVLDARDQLKESIPNPNCTLEIVEDTFMKENECMIETDGGVFDCGLGTELEELSKKLKLLSTV